MGFWGDKKSLNKQYSGTKAGQTPAKRTANANRMGREVKRDANKAKGKMPKKS